MTTNTPPVPTSPYYKAPEKTYVLEDVLKHKPTKSSLLVVDEGKAQVQITMNGEEKPEFPFKNAFFMVNHDPRLRLSSDTYVQMIMAAGLRVKIKQPGINKSVNKWIERINLERKIEDGLYSYIQAGNMIFEKAPKNADFEEVDLATITKAVRQDDGTITAYVQEFGGFRKPNILKPKDLIHFKLTNTRREVWARGLYHALLADKGGDFKSPLLSQWKIEDDMVKIFDNYASPMMMVTFKDAGEQWIKKQETEFKKMKAGAKILTDKEFNAQIFEAKGDPKFQGYIQHLQSNIVETGSQFPIGFFNADFTSRSLAEVSDSVLGRKIKRIQKKVARQIRDEMIIPYLRAVGKDVNEEDVKVAFELESKSEVGEAELLQMFEKGVISRSEYRKHLSKKTTIELNEEDMEDTPPITSVTPTNDLRTTQPSPAAQGVDPLQQQAQLAQMQKQMETMQQLIEEKIPKPRGRPKKIE